MTRCESCHAHAFSAPYRLLFVYSVHPHVVVQARAADGAAKRYVSSNAFLPFERLLRDETGAQTEYELHGGVMLAGWLGVSAAGIIVARYFRHKKCQSLLTFF